MLLRSICRCVDGPHGTWSGHFCLTPHVAMRIGLYHPLLSHQGAWRIVSEDPCTESNRFCRTHEALCRGCPHTTCAFPPRECRGNHGVCISSLWFPADCPHQTDFHFPCHRNIEFQWHGLVPLDTRMFQHIARFVNRHYGYCVNGYSYRRRLLGLDFTASLRRANRST